MSNFLENQATSRRLAGFLAALGPLAMAGWALTVPYELSDEPETWIPEAAASSGRLQLAMAMLLVFAMTGAAGALITGLAARRAARRTGTAGLVLTLLGFSAASFAGAGYDAAAVAAYRTVGDVSTAVEVLDEYESFTAPMLAGALFPPLMGLGVILMGVAFWRGRTVPRWAAACMIGAFPVIVAGGFASTAVNALGWLLMAAAFAIAGAYRVSPAVRADA